MISLQLISSELLMTYNMEPKWSESYKLKLKDFIVCLTLSKANDKPALKLSIALLLKIPSSIYENFSKLSNSANYLKNALKNGRLCE